METDYTPKARNDRLKYALRKRNLRAADVANHLNVSKATVSHWVNSPTAIPRGNNLRTLCLFLDMDEDWYLDGRGEFNTQKHKADPRVTQHAKVGNTPAPLQTIKSWEYTEDLDPDVYVTVPRWDIHVSAGSGRVIHEEVEKDKPQSFRTDWIRRNRWNPEHLASIYADGDSMEPTIKDGGTLLVNLADKRLRDGRVYVVRYGDTVSVKRLYARLDGGLRIVSDNAEFPEVDVPRDQMDHIEIIGRVVWQAGLL